MKGEQQNGVTLEQGDSGVGWQRSRVTLEQGDTGAGWQRKGMEG